MITLHGNQSVTNTGTSGIRLDHVEVPAVVAVGETAHLSCDVDQQSDQIYSIKWYKDSDEFYEVFNYLFLFQTYFLFQTC